MKNKLLTLILFSGILAVSFSCDDDAESGLEAEFAASAVSVKAGESVTFSDLSEGQASSWKWTFEGGTPATSTLSGPTVAYNVPGTYTVTLELANKNGSSVEKKESYVTVGYGTITVDFEVDVATVKQGEAVTFTDKSTGLPETWEWKFESETGTITTSAEQNPVVTFTELGTYTVTLTASNPEYSGELVKTDYITVIDPTAVVAVFGSNYTATYSGGVIEFTDESIGTAESWDWTFEGGDPATSTDQNPSVTYNTPGRYKVTLMSSNPVKSSTLEKEGYILVVPSDGLSAFYPFNGSIDDAGPNKLASTAVGTIAFSAPDRKSVSAHTAVFNATGGFYVPDNAAFNFDTLDYSISFWMKTSVEAKMMIWQESGGKGSGDNQTWFRTLSSATNLTTFTTEDAGGGSTIHLTNAANGAVSKLYDGVWHHVVCVREKLMTRLYIDGALIKEVSSTKGYIGVSNNGNFKVGMQEGTSGYSSQYNGALDDMIVYKKALTQEEVTALFNL